MIERDHPDPAEQAELTEQDLAVATLVGRYIERRETGRAHARTTCSPSPPSSVMRP